MIVELAIALGLLSKMYSDELKEEREFKESEKRRLGGFYNLTYGEDDD